MKWMRWISLLMLAGCVTSESPRPQARAQEQSEALDWVTGLGLSRCDGLTVDPESGPEIVFDDTASIQALLGSARAGLLEPRDRCVKAYRLVFSCGEEEQVLFVSCMGEPKSISGNQPIWKDRQVRLSAEFITRLQALAANATDPDPSHNTQ